MNPYQSYRAQSVQSASNEQILIMLLEAAINDQVSAAEAIEKGDRNAFVQHLHHCRAIFVELMAALDHEAAPAVTRNLHLVYAWCLHHLNQAQRTANVDTLFNVHRVTCSMYQSWIEAIGNVDESAEAAAIGAK